MPFPISRDLCHASQNMARPIILCAIAVFFVLVVPAFSQESGEQETLSPLLLPVAEQTKPLKTLSTDSPGESKTLNIVVKCKAVDNKPVYLIDGKVYSLFQIRKRLWGLGPKWADRRDGIDSRHEVILHADKRLTSSTLTDLVWLCAERKISIWKIAIAVQDPKGVVGHIPLATALRRPAGDMSLVNQIKLHWRPLRTIIDESAIGRVQISLDGKFLERADWNGALGLLQLHLERNGQAPNSKQVFLSIDGDVPMSKTAAVIGILKKYGHLSAWSAEQVRASKSKLRLVFIEPTFGAKDARHQRISRGLHRRYSLDIDSSLSWLAQAQSENGSWDSDGFPFMSDPLSGGLPDGKGDPHCDVGLTGLAVLAFLGAGETPRHGTFKSTVSSGLTWLLKRQKKDGTFRADPNHLRIADHAMAAAAVSWASTLTRSPLFKEPARRGITATLRLLNNPQEKDEELRGNHLGKFELSWILMALKSAQNSPHPPQPADLAQLLKMIEEKVKPIKGVSQTPKTSEWLSSSPSAMMTPVDLCFHAFFEKKTEATEKRLDDKYERLFRSAWNDNVANKPIDMATLYFGTLAAYRRGGDAWGSWSRNLKSMTTGMQRKDSNFMGSYDPIGIWGKSGGRIYSTAIMTMTLQIYFRYGRTLGTK